MAIYVTLEGKIPRTPCAKEISSNLVVGTAKFKYTKATTAIEQSGVNVVNEATSNHSYTARDYQLPDIVTYLQEQTNLTRKSIVSILRKCGRLEAFKMNPQKFIEQAVTIIKNQMRLFIVDGIKSVSYTHLTLPTTPYV